VIKATKKTSQVSPRSGKDLNQVPLWYKSETLQIEPASSRHLGHTLNIRVCFPSAGHPNSHTLYNDIAKTRNPCYSTWNVFIYRTTLHASKIYPRNRPRRPLGLWDIEIPHRLDSRLRHGDKVISPTHRPRSIPQKHYFSASVTHFCWRLSKRQGLVLLEGLSQLRKIIYLVGSQTRDLPACSILPQPLRYRVPLYYVMLWQSMLMQTIGWHIRLRRVWSL
jgi:hypothetical protein